MFHCVSWGVEKQNETRIVLVSNVFCTFAPTYIRMMNKYISTWIIALVLLLTSCSDGEVMDRLDHIKSVGDSDPVTALAMLDSLEVDIRQESEYVKNKYVLIHDGARPLITSDIIQETMLKTLKYDAVSVMTKTTDTIKEVDETGKIIRTIDRSKLYNTQTPQGFKTSLIKKAHEKLKDGNFTDDCSILEALDVPVYIVNGSYNNIKITVKNDLDFAKIYI